MFEMDYKVIVSDINYGGHLGNERALIIFQQTRMEWLNSIGFDEVYLGEEGKGLIQLESHVYYKKEIMLGEILKCVIKEIVVARSNFDIVYEIINQKGEIAISGSTKMMAFDYKNKRATRIPKVFLEKISTYMNNK